MRKHLGAVGLVVMVLLAGLSVWAASNADVWEKEAKTTKVGVLDKAVFDLTAADMSGLMAVIEVSDGNTAVGTIKLKFFPEQAPNHCKNFIMLAEKGFYNNTVFHRVIKGFMIQGGDPKGNGTGGPDWTIDAEFSNLPHNKGTLSMARTNDPNSAGSQFFICLERTPHLDQKYSVFGQVVEGLDLVEKIGVTPTDQSDRPLSKKVMTKVSIVKMEAPATEEPKEPPKEAPKEEPKEAPKEPAPGSTAEATK